MSTPFYDLASLVVVPSGYKASKVYAQKPLTTDGQLTFSRASTATRVNSAGLIEKVRTNLQTYSQDFSNAVWTITNGTATHSQTDPNGGTTATKIVFSAIGALETTLSGLSTSNAYTLSIYVRSESGSVSFEMGNINGGIYETRTATTSWQRFQLTQTPSGSTRFPAWVRSTGATTLYVAFAQAEVSDFGATDYIATTSAAVSVGPVANVPRLDYHGSTCPKLLLEPQRTNLTTYSEQFDNAVWTKVATSVTANSVVSPDGSTNADTLTADGTNAEHQLRSTGVISLTSGTTYTTSIFAKAGTNNFIQFVGSGTPYPSTTYANFDLGTGTLGDKGANVTSSIVNYGNGWYRCIMTAQATGTTNVNTFLVNIVTSKTAPRGQANTLSTNVHLWGAMIEAGAYATSYVKTEAAAVTRLADACSKTGISSLIGQTEGTVFVEYKKTHAVEAGGQILILLADNSNPSATRLQVVLENNYAFLYVLNSFTVLAQSSNITIPNGVNKIAFSYGANGYKFYINGVQQFSNSTTTVPATQNLFVGNYTASTAYMSDSIAQALLFKTQLTNAQLAELTAL